MFTVQGFNSEITEELSTMSELKRTEKEIPTTSDGPQIFFTTSNQSTDQEACECPKVESGPCCSILCNWLKLLPRPHLELATPAKATLKSSQVFPCQLLPPAYRKEGSKWKHHSLCLPSDHKSEVYLGHYTVDELSCVLTVSRASTRRNSVWRLMVTLEGGRKAILVHILCLWRRWRDKTLAVGRGTHLRRRTRQESLLNSGGCSKFGVCGLILVLFAGFLF